MPYYDGSSTLLLLQDEDGVEQAYQLEKHIKIDNQDFVILRGILEDNELTDTLIVMYAYYKEGGELELEPVEDDVVLDNVEQYLFKQ